MSWSEGFDVERAGLSEGAEGTLSLMPGLSPSVRILLDLCDDDNDELELFVFFKKVISAS